MPKQYPSTLIPAYGRDYKSQKAIKVDLDQDRDFVITNLFDQYDGKPVNASDLRREGFTHVMVRYHKLTKICKVSLAEV